VLRRAGIQRQFKRPLGWRSPKGVAWLQPEQAFAVFAAADDIDSEFGLFLRVLCYTGVSVGDGLSVTRSPRSTSPGSKFTCPRPRTPMRGACA